MALYTTDLLILGSGPAGYTAGIYAARAGLKTMIVSGNQEGGQLTMTSSIENFPGFEEISGFELMDKMKQQALKLGVQFANDNIVEVDFGNRPFVCSSENGHSYKARAVIVATGSSAKWLNIPSEKKYLGYGTVSFTGDGQLRLSAAAIPPFRKLYIWRLWQIRSYWFTDAINCGLIKFCKIKFSIIRKLWLNGTVLLKKLSVRTIL